MTLIRNFAENIQSDGDLIITGDLQVDGTTTTVNSTVVDIADKNITLGVGAATNAQNDGAGISILLPDASPDEFATILYTNSSDSWSFNKTVDITGNVSADEVISASIISSSSTNPRLRLFETDTTDLNSQLQSQGGQFLIKTIPDNAATSFIRFMVDHATGDINLGYEDTGASPKLFWDASAESLGIGTNAPTSILDLTNGTDTAERAIRIQNDTVVLLTGVEGSAGNRFVGSAVGNAFFGTTSAHGLELGTNNNVRMVIDSAGNVGIGTTGPNEALEVKGSIRIDNGASFTAYQVYRDNIQYGVVGGGGNQFTIQASNNKNINLFDDSGVGLTVKDGGNVGIGSDSPNTPLEVKSSGTGESTGIRLTDTNGTTRGNIYFGGAQNLIIHGASAPLGADAPALQFATGGSTPAVRMTVLEEGNVGIGTDSPGYSLQVQETSPIVALQSTGVNASRLLLSAENDAVYIGTTYGGSNIPMIFSRGGTSSGSASMTIDASGNVGIGTSSPTQLLNLESATNPAILITDTTNTTSLLLRSQNNTSSVGTSSNHPLVFETNATEAARIDASGNLLVSDTTANPSGDNVDSGTVLHNAGLVRASTNNVAAPLDLNVKGRDGTIAEFRKDGGSVAVIGVNNNDNVYIGATASGHGGFYFGNTNVTPMAAGTRTDDTVDLGTTTYRYRNLYLSGTANVDNFVLKEGTTTVGGLYKEKTITGTGTANDPSLFAETGYGINFMINGSATKAARLDTSGNLLVGTTDNNPVNNSTDTSADDGVVLGASGSIAAARYNNTPMFANRTGDNGALIDFHKSATPVGSIGSFAGSKVYIGSPSSAGAVFATNGVMPVTDGSLADNAHDLGQTSARWKDLYLSGGVVFGTTGGDVTSKTLDDYEEGTWTPALNMTSGSVSYASQLGQYTKIGNQVTLTGWIYISSVSSPSGALNITVPFTASSTSTRPATMIMANNTTGVTGNVGMWVNPNTTSMYLQIVNDADLSALDGSNMATNSELYVTITYITT